MKNLWLIMLSLYWAAQLAHAQTPMVLKVSLVQAIEIGLAKRFDAQANALDPLIAQNLKAQKNNDWLPEITLSGNVKYNTQLQSMVMDGDMFGGSNRLTIGTKNQTVFGLDLTQNLLKPTLKTEIQIAQQERLLAEEKNIEKTTAIKMSITEAYLNVLLKEKLWRLAKATSLRNKQYLEVATERKKLKTLVENDWLKSQLDYQNAQMAEKQAFQSYDLAIATFKFQLNSTDEAVWELTDSLAMLWTMAMPLLTENPSRSELKQLAIAQQINTLKLHKSVLSSWPTVSFIANYTAQFQAQHYDYTQNYWSPYNYVGIKLSMAVSDIYKSAINAQEYKLKIRQTQWQQQQKTAEIQHETQQLYTELHNTHQNLITYQNNLDLAQKVFDNQMNMFRLGTATYSAVLDTEASVSTAQQNYAQAIYKYAIAYYQYQKAVSL